MWAATSSASSVLAIFPPKISPSAGLDFACVGEPAPNLGNSLVGLGELVLVADEGGLQKINGEL